jgi:hypothetical protein
MTYVIKNPILHFMYWAAQILQRARRTLTECQGERYRPEKHYMRGPGPKFRTASKGSMDTFTTSVNDELNSR